MAYNLNENTLSEVYSILSELGNEYIDKIPEKLFDLIKENRNLNYIPNYDFNKDLENQISDETVDFIAYLNIQYWCNEAEGRELIEKYKENEEKYQAELREKYNLDNIFNQNTTPKIIENTPVPQDQSLVEVKQGFWAKFINRIKEIFHLK